ncbi:BlaI/MecI/CopY family transcriptional regulator [Marinicrinis lubricantis]|uniref:BlaI/MecI/CopY family transcriptional regulator n=1 Tax=Marinicrinis lubricantis TaxID=2086470 RepID=A0ABW1IN84_9BACL
MVQIKKINMAEEGLNRFFGPLEARIMDILWTSGDLSIKEVQVILSQESSISVNAVMTVMNRLMDKGHLTKAVVGGGRNRVSKFSPIQSKEQFLMEQTKALTQSLVQEYGGLVVNHMVDALDDVDPELIKRLETKLIEMKNGKLP